MKKYHVKGPLNVLLLKYGQQNLDQASMEYRSSHPEVFLVKGVLKFCSKFTGEHPCRNMISIKLLRNFIEITLRHGCSPVNLLHIFRTPLGGYFWEYFHFRGNVVKQINSNIFLTSLLILLCNEDQLSVLTYQ